MGNAQVVVLLLLRVVVGITMIAHGTNHWKGGGRIEGTARWFRGLGLRYGKLQAWMSVVTEIGAGALLVIGLLTPLACAAVISRSAISPAQGGPPVDLPGAAPQPWKGQKMRW